MIVVANCIVEAFDIVYEYLSFPVLCCSPRIVVVIQVERELDTAGSDVAEVTIVANDCICLILVIAFRVSKYHDRLHSLVELVKASIIYARVYTHRSVFDLIVVKSYEL